MLVTHPAVRRAARALFGGNAYVNSETIFKFEQAYQCQIQIDKNEPLLIPSIIFNTEQDKLLFILKWT